DMMTDACAVMDAAGSHKAIIMGISQGGAATILFAATYPERVQGMVLYGTTPTFVQRNNEPSWAMPEDAYAKWIDNIEREWGGAYGLGVFAPSRLHDPALRDWWAKFLRMAASPGSITSLLKIDAQVDVRHILSSVQVPTLVIHRTQDRAVRIDAGRYLAETIPDATLIELEGNDHFFFVDAEPIIQYIEDFSHSLTNDHSPQNIFATIVYGQSRTALDCDHMMATIKRRNGRLIACADGTCTIVFDRPSHAIRCAQELNHNLENTKFGIHIGECQLRGNSLTGIALDIAQQICQVSNPQTVCVSRTIRDLIAGTGIQLEEMTIQPAGALQLPIYLVHENVS
ncbi:MAG: alpha/beta hydrolase, partial [Chloroflexota bacterium]